MSVWQGSAPTPVYTRPSDPIFAQAVRKTLWRERTKQAGSMPKAAASDPTSPTMAGEPPRGSKRWLRWGLEILGAGLLFLTAAVVTDFAYFVATLEAEAPSPTVRADGVIALTGGSERISEAFDLLTEGRAKRLLITGVNRATSPEALSGHSAGGAEIVDCCVDIDRNALNTVGNALETARWVRDKQFKSIIVVTSNYHMPRSMLEMRRVLPDTTLIAYPVISPNLKLESWWTDPTSIRLLISEYVKYASATFGVRVERSTFQRVAKAS